MPSSLMTSPVVKREFISPLINRSPLHQQHFLTQAEPKLPVITDTTPEKNQQAQTEHTAEEEQQK